MKIENVLRWYMLPPEKMRRVIFGHKGYKPEKIMYAAYLWWHKQVPSPEVMSLLMDEFHRGNIPVIYSRFMHKVVRPAVLFTSIEPVVGHKEVLKKAEEAVQKLKENFFEF